MDYQASLHDARASDGQRARVLEELAEQWRGHARDLAARLGLLARDRVWLAALNADGVDADLARCFDPDGGPIAPAALTAAVAGRSQRSSIGGFGSLRSAAP